MTGLGSPYDTSLVRRRNGSTHSNQRLDQELRHPCSRAGSCATNSLITHSVRVKQDRYEGRFLARLPVASAT